MFLADLCLIKPNQVTFLCASEPWHHPVGLRNLLKVMHQRSPERLK